MYRKRYFEVPALDRRWISVDIGLHALIQNFARERHLSMAEAVYVLIGPAMAALNGLDYEKVLQDFELIRKTDTPRSK
jgi:hypothetical protein